MEISPNNQDTTREAQMYKNSVGIGKAQNEMQLKKFLLPPHPSKKKKKKKEKKVTFEVRCWSKSWMVVQRWQRKQLSFASVFTIKQNDLETGKGRTNMIKRELKSKMSEVTVQSSSKGVQTQMNYFQGSWKKLQMWPQRCCPELWRIRENERTTWYLLL